MNQIATEPLVFCEQDVGLAVAVEIAGTDDFPPAWQGADAAA